MRCLLLVSLPLILFVAACVGETGSMGPQGEIGIQGEQGEIGPQGEPGPQGEAGPSGPQGIQGESGEQGPQGERGLRGDRGIQGERGVQGEQGEEGARGAQGPQGNNAPELADHAVIYSLRDLNYIANGLDRELGGTWARQTSSTPGNQGWARLSTTTGLVDYSYDAGYWWITPATSSPAIHRSLVTGFLMAIGVDQREAETVAQGIVSRRSTEGRACQGPGTLKFETFQADDGDWVTVVVPVFAETYSKHPAC